MYDQEYVVGQVIFTKSIHNNTDRFYKGYNYDSEIELKRFVWLPRMLQLHICINCILFELKSTKYIYYSKFDKSQTFNFVCSQPCLSDTKNFMIDM